MNEKAIIAIRSVDEPGYKIAAYFDSGKEAVEGLTKNKFALRPYDILIAINMDDVSNIQESARDFAVVRQDGTIKKIAVGTWFVYWETDDHLGGNFIMPNFMCLVQGIASRRALVKIAVHCAGSIKDISDEERSALDTMSRWVDGHVSEDDVIKSVYLSEKTRLYKVIRTIGEWALGNPMPHNASLNDLIVMVKRYSGCDWYSLSDLFRSSMPLHELFALDDKPSDSWHRQPQP